MRAVTTYRMMYEIPNILTTGVAALLRWEGAGSRSCGDVPRPRHPSTQILRTALLLSPPCLSTGITTSSLTREGAILPPYLATERRPLPRSSLGGVLPEAFELVGDSSSLFYLVGLQPFSKTPNCIALGPRPV